MEKALSGTGIPARTQPPRAGWRESVLARWLRAIEIGRLTVRFPSGAQMAFGPAESMLRAAITIRDPRLVSRMLVSGDLGLAEGYIAGEWDTPDLTALLTLGARNRHLLSGAIAGSWPATAMRRLRHARRANTPNGSRRNVAAHYDLGNDFYRLWLDGDMTYSAALFEDMAEPLAVAQQRKYRRLARCLDLRPGDRVLEIGCGWGGFAEMAAAEFGCQVVGVTLSSEQARFAQERLARAGLTAKAEIRMQDYRDIQGTFDKIVSVEMFEAVGERNWPVYFDLLKRRLRPSGRAILQTITIADSLFGAYRRNPGFIQRYIFPGGMLPSPGAFTAAVSDAGMAVTDSLSFGPSYGETLRRWTRAFQENRPAIERLGFDRRFQRTWHYYLACSEAGFDCGQLDVHQFVLERG